MKRAFAIGILLLALLACAAAGEEEVQKYWLDTDPPSCLAYDAAQDRFVLYGEDGAPLEGHLIQEAFFDEERGVHCVYVDGLYGYLDGNGWIAPPRFTDTTMFDENGLAEVRENGLWGWLKLDGTYLIEPQFEWTQSFDECGLARVWNDGLVGLVRNDGKILFAPQFDEISGFNAGGVALVRTFRHYGFILEDGTMPAKPQFDNINARGFVDDDITWVEMDGLYGYIRKDGTVLLEPQFDAANRFYGDDIAIVAKDGLFGIIRRDGTYLVEPQFDRIYSFEGEDITVVAKDGMFGYLRRDGTMLTDLVFDNAYLFSDGLGLVYKDDLYGYVNTSGAYQIEPSYPDAENFYEGLAAVSWDGELWGYINSEGECVIRPEFDMADSFDKGMATVAVYSKDESKWDDDWVWADSCYGLVGADGEMLLETEWDSIEVQEDGVVIAEKDGAERTFAFVDGVFQELAVVQNGLNLREYYPFTGSKVAVLENKPDFHWDPDYPYPGLDGATALLPVYVSFCQALYPDIIRYEDYKDNQYACFTCTKTNRAYDRLIQGETDVIFCAGPSDQELEDARNAGVEFELTPMGYESFVFIVNAGNPLENISVEQIRGVYSGQITSWEELGVENMGEIIAYQRPKNSGSQTALEALMGDTPLMEAPQNLVSDGMDDILETIEYRNFPNAIGYTFRFFCAHMVGSQVKLLAIDGVEATVENIANGTYPIITPLYAVTRKGEKNPNVALLLSFITGPEGQELLEKSGYVGLGK
ncbi:MAG: WG repeat-containing protein [Clostridia bacterium]|nr:WG repeat-containing protein [Clostridia bacterium]